MRIEDNTAKLLSAVDQRIADILEVGGEMIESTAINEALVDSGLYRGSMFHEMASKSTVRVGSWVEYAIHIEQKYKPVLQIAVVANLNAIRKLFHEKST